MTVGCKYSRIVLIFMVLCCCFDQCELENDVMIDWAPLLSNGKDVRLGENYIAARTVKNCYID